MLHVLATIEIAPGQRAEFLKHFHRLVPLVLAEEGCVEYGPTVDVATPFAAQPALRPDVVVVLEKWESLPHLQLHLAAPHMATYREAVKDLVKSVTLHVTEPA